MKFDLDIIATKAHEYLPTFDRSGLLNDVLAQLKINQHGAMERTIGRGCVNMRSRLAVP